MAKSNEPKIIWDNNEVIGDTLLSEKTKLVVAASIRNGVRYVNLRQFYKRRDGVWMPSLNGICIGIDVPTSSSEGKEHIVPLPEIERLVKECVARVKEMPLYDENNVVYSKPKEDK